MIGIHNSWKGQEKQAHWVVAVTLLLITMAANVARPLFRIYTATAHPNNGQTPFVFTAYIGGMLPCYNFPGGLPDRLGCKPILLTSCLFIHFNKRDGAVCVYKN